MEKYNFLIKKSVKNKYKFSTIYNKSFLNIFFKQREHCKKKILKINHKKDLINKRDKTYYFLKKNFIKKKKNVNILNYYKKFEVNLSLKSSYNKKFNKTSSKETSLASYIYLGLIIKKNKFLDKYQKINCILKILDKILYKKENIYKCNSHVLLKLMNYETKTLKQII